MQVGIYESLPGSFGPHHHDGVDDGDFVYEDLRKWGAITAANINTAIADLGAAGGVLILPKGDFNIDDSINLSGRVWPIKSISLLGKGRYNTRLIWTGTDNKPMIDLTGSQFMVLKDFGCHAYIGAPAQVGLLMGRMDPSCSDCHSIIRVRVTGYYKVTAIYEVTSELNVFFQTEAQNAIADPNTYAYIRTSVVELGVTSPYQTLIASDGNTGGVWFEGIIRNTGGKPAIRLRDVVNFKMYGTYMYGDGTHLIEMAGDNNPANMSSQMVLFSAIRQEGAATFGIYFATANQFDKISVKDSTIIGAAGGGGAGIYGVANAEIRRLVTENNVCPAQWEIDVDKLYLSRLDLNQANGIIHTKSRKNHFYNVGTTLNLPVDTLGTVSHQDRAVGEDGKLFEAPPLQVKGLLTFANNAAAIAGGLVVGDFYRDNADPDKVCVVH